MTWSSSGTCRGETCGDPGGRDRGCQEHPPVVSQIPVPKQRLGATARLSARSDQGPPEVLPNLNCCDFPHLRQEGARTARLQVMLQRPQKQGTGQGGDTPRPPAGHPLAACPAPGSVRRLPRHHPKDRRAEPAKNSSQEFL